MRYKKVSNAAETLEAWEEGNQLAIPILCSVAYLTLSAAVGIPFTGHEDNVPPDNSEAKTSVDEDDGAKLMETTLPEKPFITVGEIVNLKPLI